MWECQNQRWKTLMIREPGPCVYSWPLPITASDVKEVWKTKYLWLDCEKHKNLRLYCEKLENLWHDCNKHKNGRLDFENLWLDCENHKQGVCHPRNLCLPPCQLYKGPFYALPPSVHWEAKHLGIIIILPTSVCRSWASLTPPVGIIPAQGPHECELDLFAVKHLKTNSSSCRCCTVFIFQSLSKSEKEKKQLWCVCKFSLVWLSFEYAVKWIYAVHM